MTNECISYYEPGRNITGMATAAIIGCRFLKISGDRSSTVGVVGQGSVSVAPADAQGRTCGVSQADAASGSPVGVVRGAGRVVPVQATGTAIPAFTEVEAAAGGMCQAVTTGKAAGYVITSCAANGIAQVSLYN